MSAIRLLSLRASSTCLLEAFDRQSRASSTARASVICSARRSEAIPKLEPFSRSKIERGLKEPSLLQKSENAILDYCSTLEGDESYRCWRGYFELKDLEKQLPKDEVESLVIQTEGVKSLIGCLHAVTAAREKPHPEIRENETKPAPRKRADSTCPIPDGLPKTQEEIEEEEAARMPDSPFTRLLRSKGRHPAWYSQAPDHETD
ncbi:CCG-binding protein 1 [Nymphaea thermarum]|nr:CCG-binding protein 1 [Nymphaea thermarum]